MAKHERNRNKLPPCSNHCEFMFRINIYYKSALRVKIKRYSSKGVGI